MKKLKEIIKALYAYIRLKRKLRKLSKLICRDCMKYRKDVPSYPYTEKLILKERLNALYGILCCYFVENRK